MSAGPPFQIIFFDCDSTLSAVEGIDELARRAGVLEQVAPLTLAAMNGRTSLEEIYGLRLALIRPDREAVDWLGGCYVDRIVTGVRETVAALDALGKQVHIVSGGVRQAVLHLASALAVPVHRVHAVDLYFDAGGRYLGYDESSPLACSGGKGVVCRQVLAEGDGTAVLVGDGVTDLEAVSARVLVVGFGGVVRREAVIKGAGAYVDNPSLAAVLDVILTPEEQARLQGS